MNSEFVEILESCKCELKQVKDVESQLSETTSSLLNEQKELQVKLLNAGVLEKRNYESDIQSRLKTVELELAKQVDYQHYLIRNEQKRFELASLKIYIKEHYE